MSFQLYSILFLISFSNSLIVSSIYEVLAVSTFKKVLPSISVYLNFKNSVLGIKCALI